MKLTISRIFELSKALDTESGVELEEPLQFLADMAEQVLRILRNNLTFQDNFNCLVKRVNIRHNTPTAVDLGGKRPFAVLPAQVVSTRYALKRPLQYYFDGNGKFQVVGHFDDSFSSQRWANLSCSGGPSILAVLERNPFAIGDIVQVYDITGGSYANQLATVTARDSRTFSATLQGGAGTVSRVSVQGVVCAPPTQTTDVTVDLLILFS